MTSEASWADALHKVIGERDVLQAHVEALKQAALIERQVWVDRVEAGRNDALREAAEEAKKTLASYAVDQGSTKTTRGRSANFYGRKAQDAILALIKEPKK